MSQIPDQTTRSGLDLIGAAALDAAIKTIGRGRPFGEVELQYLAGSVLTAAMPGYLSLPSVDRSDTTEA